MGNDDFVFKEESSFSPEKELENLLMGMRWKK